MTEKELLKVCGSSLRSILARCAPYWTSEVYSFGKHIRKYGYYPSFLPLCIYNDHGIGLEDYSSKDELKSDAPVMFCYTESRIAEWKIASKKPCYPLFSPFVFYRRKKNIEIESNAAGTIAFYSHSTDCIDNFLDPDIYINQLLKLPKKFHPVSVCLHATDVKKGVYKKFFEKNIPVYTAGDPFSPFFAQRFYSILKKFLFSTSNIAGSYLFYSVEMGLPFFIYGNHPKYFNYKDKNIETGIYRSYLKNNNYKKINNSFNVIRDKITKDQKDLVEYFLGINSGISRFKMALTLYRSFFIFLFSSRSIKWLYRIYFKIKNK